MNISNSKLESTLVSMAGTLIYLRDMTSTLAKKPVVPKAVAPVMTSTQGELAMLEVQFEAARRAAHVDAQPFLDEWLRRTGLQIGGVFRGRTVAIGPGRSLQVEGGIDSAQLYNCVVAGIRVVDIALADACIALPHYTVPTVSGIPTQAQDSYNLVAMRDFEVIDSAAGTRKEVLHVRVPIQYAERTAWASSGKLIL